MNNRFRIWFAVGVVFSLTFLVSLTAFAQGNEEPISFAKTLLVKIDGGAYTTGDNIPVSIPLAEIRKTAPDFNTDFFRVKHTFAVFEPRDIPSQILTLPGRKKKDSDLVFKVDLEKNTPLTVEIQYNPKGKDYPNYPAKTQSFASWYRLGINIAWENEIMAYRSYGGIVDFFAKTYPHLRLHNLPPDSYHHERFWGLDAYMVGAKPGLCGVILVDGDKRIPCYDTTEDSPLKFKHLNTEGGPVATVAQATVSNSEGNILEENYTLYDDRFENVVTSILDKRMRGKGLLISPGIQKFEQSVYLAIDGAFMVSGTPVEEYGTIYTALIWDPADAEGTFETEDGYFVKLKPDSNGAVSYKSLAIWSRNSDSGFTETAQFQNYIKTLVQEFANPLSVTITAKR